MTPSPLCFDAAASSAQAWASTSPRERGENIRGAFESMTSQGERLAHLRDFGERQGAEGCAE